MTVDHESAVPSQELEPLPTLLPHRRLFDAVREVVLEVKQLLRDVEEKIKPSIEGLFMPLDPGFCDHLLEQLSQPFSLFVCGEFNAGKSSLINKIAGVELAETGILPTTKSLMSLSRSHLVFIDSPGTNSIIHEHQQITEQYLQRADFVLFVTSVERPLSESEVKFLHEVRDRWKRKLIILINKIDLLSPAQCNEVKEFVDRGIQSILREAVPLFLVSSRTGQGISEFEAALLAMFSEEERIRTKLMAPLSSLKVVLGELSKSLSQEEAQVLQHQVVFDKIVAQCERRVAEATLLFDGFAEQGRALFAELAYRFTHLVEEHFGFFSLLKAKITGNTEQYKSKIYEVLQELNFEGRLNAVVDNTAAKLSTFREIMISDVREQLQRAHGGTFDTIVFSRLESRMVDPQAIVNDLRESAERGMNRLLALGSAAAASGIGAKISTVAPLEITAVILMVGLGFFSFRALPTERRKLKLQIQESFTQLGDNFASLLSEGIQRQLAQGVSLIERDLVGDREKLAERSRSAQMLREKTTDASETISHVEAQIATLTL